MNNARRWYIYLVCAISLQGVTWAVIALLRNLLAGGGRDTAFIALQIASIIIALPLYLIHWLWAQRLANKEVSEREADLRGIYHYGMMAGFIGAVIANTYSLISYVLWLLVGKPGYTPSNSYVISPVEDILYNLIAIIVCGLLWVYQKRVVADDQKSLTEKDSFAGIRRLYFYVFSTWGLIMSTMALIHILRWVMYQFGSSSVSLGGNLGYLSDEVTRLIVGAPLWLIFWKQAQNLFSNPNEAEHESVLRKFYLYTIVVVAVLSAVTNATGILAGLFRRILSLPSEGDIRTPLPIIIGMVILWVYHASTLKDDATQSTESLKQGEIRKSYWYLVAGVGLAAFLTGLSGDLNLIIRAFSDGFGMSMKDALAWYTAALIAGLPVWLLPWRQAQNEAVALTPEGIEARRSKARKTYLYFFLFIATMTVLSSAVYILYRLLLLLLGERGGGDLLSGIAQAIAYAFVGVGVWLYHGSALRGDGAATRNEMALRLKDIRVAIVDTGNAGLGQSLIDKLQQDESNLNFELISLSIKDGESKEEILVKLNEAGVIVGPWPIAVDGATIPSDITQAVVNSKARKILIPVHIDGWDFAGVDLWSTEDLALQTVRAVKQWAHGEEIKAVRPKGIGKIIGS